MSSKGAKKNVSIEEVIQNKTENLEALQQQCYAVEKMLSVSASQRRRTEIERDATLQQIATAENELEDLEKALRDHVKSMKLLSSNSAEQLQQRYDTIQKTVHELEAENETLRQQTVEYIEKKEKEMRQLEEEAAAQQHHIDQKALLFGIQLKERLRNGQK